VVVCRSKAVADPDTKETIIFERYKSFDLEEIEYTSLISPSTPNHLISRKIDFDILVPASLPTYEHSPYGIVLAQVRLAVDFGYAVTPSGLISAETVEYVKANPPVAIKEEKESPPMVLGRPMILDRWQGGGKVVFPDRESASFLPYMRLTFRRIMPMYSIAKYRAQTRRKGPAIVDQDSSRDRESQPNGGSTSVTD
jgi:hypothetical protein